MHRTVMRVSIATITKTVAKVFLYSNETGLMAAMGFGLAATDKTEKGLRASSRVSALRYFSCTRLR
jgi:hypothetical protein